tara:strand:+ start:461 stop:970 length:510 start_codon:yes stop_codon:yes gene_type:complete
MLDNLILRTPLLSDFDDLLSWENDLKNNQYTDVPVFYTPSQIEDFLNSDHDLLLQNQIRFIIELNSSAVGCIDLYDYDVVNSRAGVGIYIDSNFRNKGIASKSLELLKSISIEKYLISNLYADIMSGNRSSIKIFEKANFIKNGIKSNWIRTENSFEDVLFYQCSLRKI